LKRWNASQHKNSRSIKGTMVVPCRPNADQTTTCFYLISTLFQPTVFKTFKTRYQKLDDPLRHGSRWLWKAALW